MTGTLSGKVAMVTGAAGGIGAAITRKLVAQGAAVVLADINQIPSTQLAELPAKFAFPVVMDLGNETSVIAAFEAAKQNFGSVDILVNNAAALSPELAAADLDIERMTTEVWDLSFAINSRGTMLACREALKCFGRDGGCIVNIVSNLALQGHLIQSAYSASKAAVIQLTRSIAASHGRRGVRCNAVAPGMTMTPALRGAFPEHIRKLVEAETLRNQLGDPDDIAEVVAFLASDMSRNITGQTIVADGGLASHVPGIAGFRELG